MKRELKDGGSVHNLFIYKRIAKLIPMKRELKVKDGVSAAEVLR